MFRRLLALLLLAACATYFVFVGEDEASDGLTWVELGRDNGNPAPPAELPPFDPEPSAEPGAGAAILQEALEGLPVEHDLFIQSMKLKNTMRWMMGEDLITHLGNEYY